MANTITLTEADYEAINVFLRNTAETAPFDDCGSFCTDEGDVRLENGMELYLSGRYETERTCTFRGNHYQPAEYRDDVSLDIKEASALDADGNEYKVAYDWRKIETRFAFN